MTDSEKGRGGSGPGSDPPNLIISSGITHKGIASSLFHRGSCRDCINREGKWCRCRPIVERLTPGILPGNPGRVRLYDAHAICQGNFYRRGRT